MKQTLGFVLSLALFAAGAGTAMAAADSGGSDLGYTAMQQGQWQKAEEQLRAELKANPNEPMRLLNLAFVLQHTGRPTEAAEMYQQVLTLNSNPLLAVGPDRDIKPARAKAIARKSMAALASQK